MDLNQVTKAYLAMRAKRGEIKRAYEEEDNDIKEKMGVLEAIMLRHLNDNKLESVKTSHGTFYRTEALKPSASDWELFYDWIKENDAFDALERRIKAAFIREHLETHDGELPPGVSVHREYNVIVRKS